MIKIQIFKTPVETAGKCGDYLIKLADGIKPFNIALSGGSTPKLLFNYLAEKYSESTVWQEVHFYWGDERCVPPDDEESNYKMTKDFLFDKIQIPAANIHRVFGENNPEREAVRYSSEIKENLPQSNGLPLFDLVILGMGDDGHAASIFPHQIELLESQNICEVAEHPVSGQKRITLTGKVINNAKEIVFLVTGENKKEKVSEIRNHNGKWKTYPASLINPIDGKLTWYLDKAAAELL